MKKILCLLMAAMLVVLIMEPMETRAAAESVTVNVDVGIPNTVELESYMLGDNETWCSFFKVSVPVNYDFVYDSDSRFLGYWAGQTRTTLIMSPVFGDYSGEWQLSNVIVPDDFRAMFIGNTHGYLLDGTDNEIRTVVDFLTPYDYPSYSSSFKFQVIYEFSFFLYSGDILELPSRLYDISVSTSTGDMWCRDTMWTNNDKRILNKIQDLKDGLLDKLTGFQTSVENKFTTWFTFGRQWTDDIIDAIVGQSGGGGISSAQDELDDQLNSIEVVEQQLSDQVADKIEVPSVSLNADETGGLRWVITTINSLYLSFNELHVMFACVVFFGIIAVLLFGRRNL